MHKQLLIFAALASFAAQAAEAAAHSPEETLEHALGAAARNYIEGKLGIRPTEPPSDHHPAYNLNVPQRFAATCSTDMAMLFLLGTRVGGTPHQLMGVWQNDAKDILPSIVVNQQGIAVKTDGTLVTKAEVDAALAALPAEKAEGCDIIRHFLVHLAMLLEPSA